MVEFNGSDPFGDFIDSGLSGLGREEVCLQKKHASFCKRRKNQRRWPVSS